MKIAKGVLTDAERQDHELKKTSPAASAAPSPQLRPEPVVVEKNRLFETVEKETGSERNYLKVLLVVAALVVIGGGLIFYFTLPSVGDKVLAPKGLEQATREYLLDKQKRVSTDIAFYYCGDSYWGRSGVETRNDLPNPVFRIATYAVRAVRQSDDTWQIDAKPVSVPDDDIPCR
ncbi:MAG TPA: hypothetical protein VGO43_00740 [Pyrinomonadaceae bacterium]|jgi:hypothetical protein|nr:hypothetical protein [Pyrinomonadaceae bacterium]